MVCHSPGRSCVPDSRGSRAGAEDLSASVMDPPPRFADQIKMQMKEEQGESRFVLLQHLRNELTVCRLVAEQDLEGLGPRSVNLLPAGGLIAVAKVQTHKANQLLNIALCRRLAQVGNRHSALHHQSLRLNILRKWTRVPHCSNFTSSMKALIR